MNLPGQVPGAYAAAMGLWGAATGQWPWALAAAAALEVPRALGWRLDIDERGFRTAWLLGLFLVWLLSIQAWLEDSRPEGLRLLAEWLPLAALPLALAAALARRPAIPVSALLLLLKSRYRRPTMGGVVPPVPAIDPFFPVFWVILLSASTQASGRWFFPIAAAAVGWVAMFHAGRRQRLRLGLWLALAFVAAGSIQSGIRSLHKWIDQTLMAAVGGGAFEWENSRALTRIGGVAEIKNSTRVRWRLAAERGPAPPLLADATYNFFSRDVWANNGNRGFRALPPLEPGPDPAGWRVGRPRSAPETPAAPAGILRLGGRANMAWTVLPLPPEATELHLPHARIEANNLGVVRADSELPLLQCRIHTGTAGARQPPPTMLDLEVPASLEPLLRRHQRELGLDPDQASAALAALDAWFGREFAYTRKIGDTDIRSFLGDRRRGHCEFFATAAALLLRAAGIPARYQTGFAVSEWDPAQAQWLLRGVHAHAWIIAWIDGRWQTFDPTPPDWLAADAGLPPWQQLIDWWDARRLAFEMWRETSNPAASLARFAPWLLALAVAYTIVRFWMEQRRKTRASRPIHDGPRYRGQPNGSLWSQLEPAITRAWGPRPPHLPPLSWLESLPEWPAALRDPARKLVRDHYHRRFGPAAPAPHDPALAEAAARLQQHFHNRRQAGE
jgi:protein-glutamine gamma-glutamyltransferase